MTMIGDAISHAVLPGIVLAYFATHTYASLPMLIGAALFGVLVTVFIETLHKSGKLQADAAIGISYTLMFAIGVILISVFAGQVDLDQDCVLYGEIIFIPFDTFSIGGWEIPRTVILLSGVCIGVVAFIWIGYKALLVTSFDPLLAQVLGISTAFWHYALMGAVSVTTVMSFEAVGAIIVVAFLVVPAATAYLLTNQLMTMLFFSVGLGCSASVLGYYFAAALDASIAGGMATCLGLQFVFVFVWVEIKKSRQKQEALSTVE